MENFDVLNEMGEFTNEIASREECHKKGLYHKAVVVFIINSKNEVLIQQRSSNKKLWPSKWDITAGGHVDAGEFGFQAVIRETKEEIGIDITEKDLLFLFCYMFACMLICAPCVQHLWRLEEGTGSPGTRVTECWLRAGCWFYNPGIVEELQLPS